MASSQGMPQKALALHGATVPGRIADVSLEIPAGMLVGLVGPNGAGKSTLLQVAAGLLPAAGGTVNWSGRPLDEIAEVDEVGPGPRHLPRDLRFGLAVEPVARDDADRSVKCHTGFP